MPDPDDPTLRSAEAKDALEELVAACILALSEGDTPAVEKLLLAKPRLAAAARAQLSDLMQTGLIEDEPQQIGPYRILEPLGRGGMGMVYLAEQREPVQRRVAVKLVKPGMDTREVLARFAAERQALALMNHQHIAKVFDAGSTPEGRPYFAMEHVAGLPITDYCDRRSLDTTERIELFLPVCEGVQHAHQKGIIHRDLKPSNVLVSETDGKPCPKIIDFGIAKAIDHRLGGATLHTRLGVLLGTPEYMSPEQAGRDALDVDARTDVYSLGVLLYELLTGDLPFEADRLRTDLDRLQRILREEEPTSPSRKLATQREETKARARARRSTPYELVRRLRGDLDWICLKALEKDRERRYATPNELAADLRRHLDWEPVLAGPPTRRYRLAKFVRRNRLQVGAAAAVFLALVGGLIASLVFQRKAEDAAAGARAAQQRESIARGGAERDFSHALEAVEVLLTRVGDKRLDGIPRAEAVRRSILEDAAKFYRRFLAERGADVRTSFQAAGARAALARLLEALGEDARSIAESELALAAYDALLADHPEDRRLRLHRAKAFDGLAQTLDHQGRGEEARAKFSSALDDWRALHERDPRDDNALWYLVAGLNNFAVQHRRSEPERALEIWTESAELLEGRRSRDDAPAWVSELMPAIRTGIGTALYAVGNLEGARAALGAARAEFEKSDLDKQTKVDFVELGIDIYLYLALAEYRLGRSAEAVGAGRQHVAIAERLIREHPEVPAYQGMLATGQGNLALYLAATGAKAEARAASRGAADAITVLFRQRPHDPQAKKSFFTFVQNLAQSLFRDGTRKSLAEARHRIREVLETTRADPSSKDRYARGSRALTLLAEIERADGHLEVAREHVREALDLGSEWCTAEPSSPDAARCFARTSCSAAQIEHELGAIHASRERAAIARTTLERAHELGRPEAEDAELAFEIACVDALAAVENDAAEAERLAILLVDTCPDADWRGLAARAEVKVALWRRSPSPSQAVVAEASIAEALDVLEARVAENAGLVAERRAKAQLEIDLAAIRSACGEGEAARELLVPALHLLRELRPRAHHLPSAELRLRDGAVLQAELLLASGDRAGAIGELEQCAAEFPGACSEVLDRDVWSALAGDERFRALRAR